MMNVSFPSIRIHARPARAAITVLFGVLSLSAQAFESDVHFGLTKWMAIKAGFSESQAHAIAVGNQRVDSGLMDTLQVAMEYGCAGRFPHIAKEAQERHFPASGDADASALPVNVVPSGPGAREALDALLRDVKGKEGLLLGKLGAAMHTLQDSWSHQGEPSTPLPGESLACDAGLVLGHPISRGGAHSHDADLAHLWPQDVQAMSLATYNELLAYPKIQDIARKAAPWQSVSQALEGYTKARTKSQMREWFIGQGIEDTSFLQGVTLPDGPAPGRLDWGGRKLPPLGSATSNQHDAPVEVRSFFDGLIARWLALDDMTLVVTEMTSDSQDGSGNGKKLKLNASQRQLAARLKLWRLHDHGSAAELAHAKAPLSATQLRAIDRLSKEPAAFANYDVAADAFFPLQALGPHASPLLPYIVRELPEAAGRQRFIAIARLKHAPYDTVGWIAERQDKRWVLVDIISVVDQ